MARGSKRQRKKLEKQKQQQFLTSRQIPDKKVKKLTSSELNKEYNKIVSQEQKKDQRKKAFQYRVSQKRQKLHQLGFNIAVDKKNGRNVLSDKRIDSIKQSDLDSGNIKRENYSFLFGTSTFDFDKVYEVKNGERLFFAFQDWTGDALPFGELIEIFKKYEPQTLLDFLENIVRTTPQATKTSKGWAGSSGKAGTYKFQVAKQEVIATFNKEVTSYNRSKKSKRKFKKKHAHTLDYRQPWQVLKDKNRNSFDKISARQLLQITNAIMYNINELDRQNFYQEFYPAVNRVLPEIGKILPKP